MTKKQPAKPVPMSLSEISDELTELHISDCELARQQDANRSRRNLLVSQLAALASMDEIRRATQGS